MALAATWRESASLIHEASYRKENLSLGGVLLRDGELSFPVLACKYGKQLNDRQRFISVSPSRFLPV